MPNSRPPQGKNADDTYVSVTAQVPRELCDELRLELNRADETLDINTLVEGLLKAWLSGEVKVSAPVEKPDINEVLCDTAKDAVWLGRWLIQMQGYSKTKLIDYLNCGKGTINGFVEGVYYNKGSKDDWGRLSQQMANTHLSSLFAVLDAEARDTYYKWQLSERFLTDDPTGQFVGKQS
jgi:hypothetical protein